MNFRTTAVIFGLVAVVVAGLLVAALVESFGDKEPRPEEGLVGHRAPATAGFFLARGFLAGDGFLSRPAAPPRPRKDSMTWG